MKRKIFSSYCLSLVQTFKARKEPTKEMYLVLIAQKNLEKYLRLRHFQMDKEGYLSNVVDLVLSSYLNTFPYLALEDF